MNDVTTAPNLAAALPEIPFQRVILDNGLTLLVHESADSPTVAVHVAYGVGAKDEPAGRFGLAHLMEHLMFSGSATLPGSYISHLERAGAEGLNGVTSADITQFFQSVPPGSLDYTLFAEADRMGWLAGGLSPQALEVQRDVVTREMEENELQPLGAVQGAILRHLFPAEHPYAHKVAGERADLQQVSFADVQAWSQRFYRPDNAVITLAGAVTTDAAREKVQRWFGDIAPGAARETVQRWLPALAQEKRLRLEDHIDNRLLRICWTMPPFGEEDATALELFAGVLADTAWSPLVVRLMVDNQLATEISAFVESGMLASYFNLRIELQPGVSADEVERHALAALDEMRTTPLNPDLLQHSQQLLLENSRSEWADPLRLAAALGRHEHSPQRAEGLRQRVVQALTMPAETVVAAAQHWLHQGRLVVTVDPITTVAARRDPALTPPPITVAPLPPAPVAERRILSNGLKIVVVPAMQPGLLSASLIVNAGSQFDPPKHDGLAQLVAGLVAGGENDGITLEQWLWSQDAGIALDVGATSIALRMQMPEPNAAQVFHHLSAVLRSDPTLADSMEAHREHYRQVLNDLDNTSWALPAISFPPQHPLKRPAFIQGTPDSLAQLTPEAASAFYQRHYQPHNASLLLRSSLPVEQLIALLENSLAQWQSGAVPAPEKPAIPPADTTGALLLIDNPAAAVSTLKAWFVLPGSGSPHDAAVQLIHPLLAASFASRINFALREVDRLTYNVTPLMQSLPGSRLLGFELSVAAENTLAAVRAIRRECDALLGDRPLTAQELAGLIQIEQLRLSRPVGNDFEALCQQESLLREGLPEDYRQRLLDDITGLSVDRIDPLLRQAIAPGYGKWLITGAVSAIADELSAILSLPAGHFPPQPEELYK
ncbi:insulinase family protein [Erwinia sp. S43]|uniref:M16 family metallopeptidase n=1 Tax=Erwinia sp. S43 TaxID=2769339 RepID=UPI00190CEA0E|nr:M16 family metallopeptidase [Erwinia sp. S43]MBK0034495.1 insulinase family protein [Erwinia sp. S43]